MVSCSPRDNITRIDNQISINTSDCISNFNNLFDKLELVALESNATSQIGEIFKIIPKGKYIGILDEQITKSVFLFESNGTFVSKIQNLGKGMGEYGALNDFNIDTKNGKLLLLADFSWKNDGI